MSRDGPVVYAYPSEEQLDRWDQRKEHVGASSRSQFVCDMVEAGIKADKGFKSTVTPDESVHELRRQRNDLRDELDHARARIEELEEQLHHGERETIEAFVEENPGVSYDQIVRHVIDTVPERLGRHLDDMEGVTLRRAPETGAYYPADEDRAGGDS